MFLLLKRERERRHRWTPSLDCSVDRAGDLLEFVENVDLDAFYFFGVARRFAGAFLVTFFLATFFRATPGVFFRLPCFLMLGLRLFFFFAASSVGGGAGCGASASRPGHRTSADMGFSFWSTE